MPLFTDTDLAAAVQQPSVNADTFALILELTEDLIAETYGAEVPTEIPPRLRRIGLKVAKRAYLNPNGYVSESLGDYSYNRGGRSSADEDWVYLTPAEARAIASLGGRATVRTAQLVQPYYGTDDVYDPDLWP